jgi:hypothetical protein
MAYTILDGFGVRTILTQSSPYGTNPKELVRKQISLDLSLVVSYSKYILGDIRTGNLSLRSDITEVWLNGSTQSVIINMTPADFGALLPIGPGIDPSKVKVSSADTTADFLENKLVAGTGISIAKLNPGADEDLEIRSAFENIYLNDGNVADGRIATLDGTLTWDGGKEIRTVNGRIIREVTEASDLPATLVANTTYIIRGEISISSAITCNVEGVEIMGLDRNLDHLIWDGLGPMITIVDVNFGMSGIRVSGTRATGSIISATNINAGAYNAGRLKVLTFLNCQFRGTYDVMDIKGFDLVDINNCLFFYIKALNFGLRFEDTSKIEITSCELIRWFDESTIPTPSGWATCSMIELLPNNLASFGAVNINGCVVHPQQTQNGIEIAAGSTTGFGTISSNAFVTVGLTTGKVFLPEVPVVLLPDYSQPQTIGYDVFANQGILNSTSGTVMTLTGNTTDTVLSTGVPVIVNTGGGVVQQAGVRYTVSTGGRATYIGTKQKFVSIHTTIAFQKQGGGTDPYIFYLYKNGVQLPGSQVGVVSGGATADSTIALVYGTPMIQNDYIEIYVENPSSSDNMLVKDFQMVIRE